MLSTARNDLCTKMFSDDGELEHFHRYLTNILKHLETILRKFLAVSDAAKAFNGTCEIYIFLFKHIV